MPFHSLITNASTAIWAIAAADTWEWFPFTMLMLLAALQMVPKEPLGSRAHRWGQHVPALLACAAAVHLGRR